MICCRQKLGFYQTSEGLELGEELLETVGISADQLEGINENLQQELDDAEHMLIG